MKVNSTTIREGIWELWGRVRIYSKYNYTDYVENKALLATFSSFELAEHYINNSILNKNNSLTDGPPPNPFDCNYKYCFSSKSLLFKYESYELIKKHKHGPVPHNPEINLEPTLNSKKTYGF